MTEDRGAGPLAQLRRCGIRFSERRDDRRQDFDLDERRTRQRASGSERRARAAHHRRNDRTAGPRGSDERTRMKLQKPGLRGERSFGEEYQRMATHGIAQHAPGIARALAAIETLDELRPDAP